MKLCFTLTMPSTGGASKWSGAGKLYTLFRNLSNPDWVASILGKTPYYYNFRDGWIAQVDVKAVTESEAEKIKLDSEDGFWGYEWMVESIIDHQEIKA